MDIDIELKLSYNEIRELLKLLTHKNLITSKDLNLDFNIYIGVKNGIKTNQRIWR